MRFGWGQLPILLFFAANVAEASDKRLTLVGSMTPEVFELNTDAPYTRLYFDVVGSAPVVPELVMVPPLRSNRIFFDGEADCTYMGTTEPGYYKSGGFGIRLENLVVVTEAKVANDGGGIWLKFETLTQVPFDRSLIDQTLLTSSERDWLNAYHARVKDLLQSLVDQDTTQWLEKATATI